MRIERLPTPEDFLAATAELRAREPVLTNVIGSVAGSVAAGRRYESCAWWVVRDGDGVVGCAVHTAPWPLALSPMAPAAAAALGAAVRDQGPRPTSATGPDDAVAAFWGAAAPGEPQRTAMTDVVHVLGTYVPPPPVPGAARRAAEADLPLLVEWHVAFAHDAGLPVVDVEASVRTRLDAGALWLWAAGGAPVAMAGHAPLVATPAGDVARVGPVFTPQPLRRNGFGAAVTAAVVEHLVPRCAVVMLFADAANPTSNGVYERLGFRPVARIVEVEAG